MLDERIAVRLAFDDHDRFVYATVVGPESLDRYRSIRDVWWAAAAEE